ncbi:MAG: GNAT family N-acetyltransferase, partial [Clostridia bacterium]|nr:GNAT family N-acetyltransferase [Clostridia bacterium]
MSKVSIVSIAQRPQLLERAADWFHAKWGIPRAAYEKSMRGSLESEAVPCWLVALDGETIVGGLGVIENDFHQRKDLAPNVCAVYVEN